MANNLAVFFNSDFTVVPLMLVSESEAAAT
jgi:hypothetical protein